MKIYEKKDNSSKSYHWSVNSEFGIQLNKYGLGGKTAKDKFIPKEALRSDLNYRKYLLAGLIDGDGEYSNGTYKIVSKSSKLIKDIEYLVWSIGGRVNLVNTRIGTIKSYGFSAKYWQISFFIHELLELPIINVKKKKKRNSYMLKSNNLSIKAVKNDNSHEVYGFTLDSPTGYYITDNWMLTHNSGKSIVTLSLGLLLFPKFSYKNMLFYDQEILDNVDKFPKNTLIVRDENPAEAIFGQGSQRTAGQLSTLSKTCRKEGVNLAFIEPSFNPNQLIKWYIEVVDQDREQRITRCALMDGYTMKYVGAILVPVVSEENKDWIEYNKIKDQFTDRMKKGDFSGAKLDYDKIVDDVISDPEFYKYKNKKEKKAYLVTKYQNYTGGEIDTILSMVLVKMREDG